MNEHLALFVEAVAVGLVLRALWDGMWANYFKAKYQPRPGHYIVTIGLYSVDAVSNGRITHHEVSYMSEATNTATLVVKEAVIKADDMRKSIPHMDHDTIHVAIHVQWVEGVN